MDVWTIRLGTDPALPGALDVLVEDELARASRYRFADDRRVFVQCRAALRSVLARYVGGSPRDVLLGATPSGRPLLTDRRSPRFSVSRTRGLAVVAVSADRPVGVDVERIRPIVDAVELARSLFAPAEATWLESAPPHRRSELFLTLWTRKESYVKALGTGLSTPLDGFEVRDSRPDGSGRPRGPSGPAPFAFMGLAAIDGFIGTVTAAGTHVTLRTRTP